MDEKNGTGNSSVQSIDRALDLLDELAASGKGCSIKSLSEKTGLHKATVHRLLQTLMHHNYVRKNPQTDEYHLGYHILNLSTKLINTLDIRSVASPYLKDICARVGQVVQLSVLQGNNAVFIDKVEPPNQSIRMYSEIGKSIPAYCSSSGKALLAWQEEPVQRALIDSIEFFKFTQTTITGREELIRTLNDVRAKGFATDWFEHEDGIFCVAAPIFNNSNHTIAAVCIAGTIFQMSPGDLLGYIEILTENAASISHELGCIQSPVVFDRQKAEEDIEILSNILRHSPVFHSPSL